MINYEFLKQNQEKLKQIYYKERILNQCKLGALFIDFSKGCPDVYFLTLENMPETIKQKFLQKENLNQLNTIFLYVFDQNDSKIMDVLI